MPKQTTKTNSTQVQINTGFASTGVVTVQTPQLTDLFDPADIEWRLGSIGRSSQGVWAKALAFVQSRAIQTRLDAVYGASGWRVKYRFEKTSIDAQGQVTFTGGVICTLSVRTPTGWVSKEDGAEQTDFEAFKGGISSAFKRAGSAWGIGRYLYDFEATFVKTSTEKVKGWNYTRDKTHGEFWWETPQVPDWANPKKVTAQTSTAEKTGPGDEQGNSASPATSAKTPQQVENNRTALGFAIVQEVKRIGLSSKEFTDWVKTDYKVASTKDLTVDQMKNLYESLAREHARGNRHLNA